MSGPQRLLEGGTGLATTLLRAGCEERPSSDTIERTLVAIGVTTAVGAAAGEAAGGAAITGTLGASTAAHAGASSISLAFAAKWLAIGGLGGLVTMGAATELAGPRAQQPSESATAVATSTRATSMTPWLRVRPDVTAQPPLASSPKEPAPLPIASSPHDPMPDRAPPARQPDWIAPGVRAPAELAVASVATSPTLHPLPLREPVGVPGSTPPVAAGSSGDNDVPAARLGSSELSLRLNHQVTVIDGAWAALKRNDPAAALRALSAYERTFPLLDLHPEVLFLRMRAEEARGQKFAAREEASRIVALYPRSAQASRARELLARP